MPSLTKLLLAFAATATRLTLAAPTTDATTSLTTTPFLTKRADYHPSPSSEDDYCGEAVAQYSTTSTSPLASDCAQIYQTNPGPGYWLVSPAETNSKPDRWTRLASSGTCAFEARLSTENAGDAVEYRFGTNDVRFYLRSHASASQAQDGKVGVRSGVWCRRVQGGQVRVDWRVVRS